MKVVLGFLELAMAVKFLSNADLVEQWGILKREIFIGFWIIVGALIVLYGIAAAFDALMGPGGHGIPSADVLLTANWDGIRTVVVDQDLRGDSSGGRLIITRAASAFQIIAGLDM